MPKIFITAVQLNSGSWVGGALAEDGIGLRQHISSNKLWCKSDMGLTMDTHVSHLDYRKYYPDGYTLVDLVDATDEELSSNQEYLDALAANQLEESEEEYTDQAPIEVGEGSAGELLQAVSESEDADLPGDGGTDDALAQSLHDEGGPTGEVRD